MVHSLSFETLTPTSFLDRANAAHGDRVAVVDGAERWTYREFHDRCSRLAGGLHSLGGRRPVAVLAPNSHVMLEAHYGVPWSGRALVAVNTRLSAAEVRYILEHSEAAVLIYDGDFQELVEAACEELSVRPVLVRSGDEYEALLAASEPYRSTPADEQGLLSINYTSGTTGKPKGVMYSHRGAYLQALAMVGHTALSPSSVHLWTLPMFHCNGWCFTWAVTAAAGTHVCLPKVDPTHVWNLIRRESVTHLNGAPTVLSTLAYAPEAGQSTAPNPPVRVVIGGAPPSRAVLKQAATAGFDVTHMYGLTETYGPVTVCDWRPEWNGLPDDEKAVLMARQGVGNMVTNGPRVISDDGGDVPRDGETLGEIAFRGNNVMVGYYRDAKATADSTPGGWFHTGDVGVMHPDGYVELRDRRKDVIISGGENIASVEVELVVMDHPSVRGAAVVGRRDDKWGEVPVAHVELHPGLSATEAEIIEFVRDRLARFKAPKAVVFGDLPRTSTGKIRKVALRDSTSPIETY